MNLTVDHIGKLLKRKEDDRVEFKRTTSELPDNLWETYSARKRLNHRGPSSIYVSSAWYFITISADSHAPWIADEVKVGRAVAPRPPSIELMSEEWRVA